MKLNVSKRAGDKKSELSLIRHRGDIPAILYSKEKENVMVTVDGGEFGAVLRTMKKGHLPTTVFDVKLDGKSQKAIVKDISYNPTTYNVSHLDFLIIDEKTPLKVNVPLGFKGVEDSVGVKLGGFLRPIMRHIKVRCMPKDLPKSFTLDVSKVGLSQSRKVKDISLPKGVEALSAQEEVVVVIAKR